MSEDFNTEEECSRCPVLVDLTGAPGWQWIFRLSTGWWCRCFVSDWTFPLWRHTMSVFCCLLRWTTWLPKASTGWNSTPRWNSCELENVSTLTKWPVIDGWNVNSRLTIPLKHHIALAQAAHWPPSSIYLTLHYLHCVTQRRLMGGGLKSAPFPLFTRQKAKVRAGNRMRTLNTVSNWIHISYMIMRARPGLKRVLVQHKTARSRWIKVTAEI